MAGTVFYVQKVVYHSSTTRADGVVVSPDGASRLQDYDIAYRGFLFEHRETFTVPDETSDEVAAADYSRRVLPLKQKAERVGGVPETRTLDGIVKPFSIVR